MCTFDLPNTSNNSNGIHCSVSCFVLLLACAVFVAHEWVHSARMLLYTHTHRFLCIECLLNVCALYICNTRYFLFEFLALIPSFVNTSSFKEFDMCMSEVAFYWKRYCTVLLSSVICVSYRVLSFVHWIKRMHLSFILIRPFFSPHFIDNLVWFHQCLLTFDPVSQFEVITSIKMIYVLPPLSARSSKYDTDRTWEKKSHEFNGHNIFKNKWNISFMSLIYSSLFSYERNQ